MGLSIDPPPRRGSSAGVNVDPKAGSLEQSLQPGMERELGGLRAEWEMEPPFCAADGGALP